MKKRNSIRPTPSNESSERNLIILGDAGFAREVAWLVRDINHREPKKWNLIGFCGHKALPKDRRISSLPVLGMEDIKKFLPQLYAVAAIGNPLLKKRAISEAQDIGCRFATLVHPTVQYDKATVSIGPGSIICAGSILTVDIRIGAHVTINLGCTIGHDCSIDDFATISPGVHLSGYTIVREGAYLGTGVVTIEKHEIGSYSIIGAGACVNKDIPSGVIAAGVPARVIRKHE